MESKKINQLATELAPVLSDLTIIGDPTTGISKKITLSQMASLFTGTVEEYPNLAAFPLVGVADTIYIALDTNILYRWNTSTNSYNELSPNVIASLIFNDANGFDGTISLVGSTATLTITTALTTGSVGFIGASGALLQDNANFFWNNTTKRLGINTNAPTTALDVFGSGIIGRLNGTSTNNAFLGFSSAGTNKWSIGNVQSDHRFRIFSETNTAELVSVLQTGEFGIGIANPTTKLHIDGAASALIANLDANVSVAKSISFRSDNSNRINLEVSGTESGSNAGANFFLRTYTDAGALIETPLSIVRSTGITTIKSLTLTNALSVANGGTGSTTQNFVDLTTAQSIGGAKTFTGALSGTSAAFSSSVSINGANNTSELNIYAASQPRITFQNSGANRAYISADGGNTIYNSLTGNGHQFQVDGSIKVAITGSGNVGIGTSNVVGISTNYGTLNINGSNGGGIICKVNDTSRGYFYSAAEGTYIIEAASAPIFMYTGGSERMRIASDGTTTFRPSGIGGIGIVNANTTSGGQSIYSELGVNSNNTSATHFVGAQSGFGNRINIFGNGNITNSNGSYGAISDIKLKENIIDATDKLEKLLKVRIVNYNLIGDKQKQIGVIAQELEQIFPSIVDETEDFENIEITDEEGNITKEKQSLGTYTKSVKYSVFVPMLIKAIQEQQVQIETQDAKIEELKALIAAK